MIETLYPGTGASDQAAGLYVSDVLTGPDDGEEFRRSGWVPSPPGGGRGGAVWSPVSPSAP